MNLACAGWPLSDFEGASSVRNLISWFTMTLFVFALLVAGCGRTGPQEPPRYPISGTVTLDGKPLPQGTVYFRTVSLGLIERVPIKDGTFAGRVAAGERRIEFSVIKDVKYTGPTMPGVPSPETVLAETLPAAFNADSNFTVTVTPDGPNQFTFELMSKKLL
jgi:hypothetical protein